MLVHTMAGKHSLGLLIAITLAAAAISACGVSAASDSNSNGPEPIETSIAILFPEMVGATARAATGDFRFGQLIETTDLLPGDCINIETDPFQGSDVEEVQLLECENANSQFRVTKRVPQADKAYPGESTLLGRIGMCGLGKRSAFVPSKDEWEQEEFRDIVCLYAVKRAS